MNQRLVFVAAFASNLVGCKCDDADRPYTPFGVATSSDAHDSSSSTASAPHAPTPAPFEPTAAEHHEPPVASLRVGELELKAPKGQLIERSLHPDTSSPVVFAWTVAGPGSSSLGGLHRLEPEGARPLLEFPALVPSDPSCERSIHLEHTGPNTLTVDVSARCPSGGIPRAPTRALTVFKIAQESPALTLRLAEPPAGERLTLSSDTRDRDGDGHDDIALTFSVEREGSSRSSSAPLLWLDRAAGAARDDTQPSAALSDIGSVEVVRAAGKNTSAEVFARVDNARRLFAYLCSESGTFRVTDDTGSALPCGDVSLAFERFRLAELRAALTRRDYSRALSTFDRSDWYGPGPSARELSTLRKELHAALRPIPTEHRALAISARSPGSGPRFSPLAFDGSGQLLIQTPTQIARAEGPVVRDVSEEIDPWPLLPLAPDGTQIMGISYPCDSAFVGITARRPDGSLVTLLETDWLPPRPGACAGDSFNQPELRVVSFQGSRLHALVGAGAFGDPPRGAPMGSPSSPDGRSLVHTTSEGLLVVNDSKTQLWQLERDALTECVIDNEAKTVACLDARNAPVIITPRGSRATSDPP